ncbi:MAG: peptide chain release factor N(5)-glutamine methyltransferase [Actinomycetales bacterium]|nr:peptide chain release factor N(5)-glutamine methyltransferase [Actinomycetales bacterium]
MTGRPLGDLSTETTAGGRATVRDVLVDAERRMAAVGVPSPSVDSSSIVAHVLQTTRSRLFLHDPVSDDQRVRIEHLVSRRLARMPLQYLLGSAGFRRMDLQVGPGVFIPRPETELVVEAALREIRQVPAPERIAVDLCAGSGAIALSLATEAEGVQAYAVELSDQALPWTVRNAQAQQAAVDAAGSSVTIVPADVRTAADAGGPLAGLAGRVSVVASNPPYVPDAMVPREPEVRDHEPPLALFGGPDGLDLVRGIARTALILLRPGGLLVIEHADVQGSDAGERGVPGLLKAQDADEELAAATGLRVGERAWTSIQDRIDLNGRPRFTMARKASAAGTPDAGAPGSGVR